MIPFAVAISVPFQAGEEVGWRGYALPRLAARFGLARASLLLGAIWAFWHLPQFLHRRRRYLPSVVRRAGRLQVVAMSVAFAWLYARTGGSLLLVMLLHAAINNTKDVVPSGTGPAPGVFSLHASSVSWITLGLLWLSAFYLLRYAWPPPIPRARKIWRAFSRARRGMSRCTQPTLLLHSRASLPSWWTARTRRGASSSTGGTRACCDSLDTLTADEASQAANGGATIRRAHPARALRPVADEPVGREGGDPFSDATWDAAWRISTVSASEWQEIRDGLRDETHRWLQVLTTPREVTKMELTGLVGSVPISPTTSAPSGRLRRARAAPGRERSDASAYRRTSCTIAHSNVS
jgi:hypothetical protein